MEESHPSSKKAVVARAIGEFFREAAVLVCVFGYLDPVLNGGDIGGGWVAAVGGATIGLFLLGLVFEIPRRPRR
jgi:membrane associated rhomboid family serine protease